jgi:hypothetical protein
MDTHTWLKDIYYCPTCNEAIGASGAPEVPLANTVWIDTVLKFAEKHKACGFSLDDEWNTNTNHMK